MFMIKIDSNKEHFRHTNIKAASFSHISVWYFSKVIWQRNEVYLNKGYTDRLQANRPVHFTKKSESKT